MTQYEHNYKSAVQLDNWSNQDGLNHNQIHAKSGHKLYKDLFFSWTVLTPTDHRDLTAHRSGYRVTALHLDCHFSQTMLGYWLISAEALKTQVWLNCSDILGSVRFFLSFFFFAANVVVKIRWRKQRSCCAWLPRGGSASRCEWTPVLKPCPREARLLTLFSCSCVRVTLRDGEVWKARHFAPQNLRGADGSGVSVTQLKGMLCRDCTLLRRLNFLRWTKFGWKSVWARVSSAACRCECLSVTAL